MVGKKQSVKRRRPKPKTFVFPYKSLEPIVRISGDKISVTPQEISERISNARSESQVKELESMIDSLMSREQGEVIETLQRKLEDRVREVENGIKTDIRRLELLLETTNPEKGNTRELIQRFQGLESRIDNSIRELGSRASPELVSRMDRITNSLTEFMIKLDGLKERLDSHERDSKRDLLNELDTLKSILKESNDTSKTDIQDTINGIVDKLKSINREEAGSIQDQLKDHMSMTEKGQELLKVLVEQLKDEMRGQIDGIVDLLGKITASESASGARTTILESQLNDSRSRVENLQSLLDESKDKIRSMESEIQISQDRIKQLEISANRSEDLTKTIENIKSEEKVKRTELRERLTNECLEKTKYLEGLLQEVRDKALKEEDRLRSGELSTKQSISKLEEEIDKYRSRIQELEGDLERNKSDVEEERAKLKTAEEQLTEARSREEELKTKLKGTESTVDELSNTISNLQSRISALEEELNSLKNDSGSRISDLEGELSNLKEDKSKAQSRISELEGELDNLRSKSKRGEEELQISSSRSQARITDLEEELSNLRERESKSQSRISELEGELDNLRGSTKSKNTELEGELSNLREDKSKAQARITELEGDIVNIKSESQTRISDLEGELSTLRERESKSQARISELEGELGSLKGKSKARSTELEGELSTLREEKSKAQSRISELEGELTNLKSVSQNRISELEGELTTLREGESKSQARISELEKELKRSIDKNESLERELAQIRELVSTLQSSTSDVELLRKAVDELSQAEKEKDRLVSEYTLRIEKLEKDITDSQNAKTEMETLLNEKIRELDMRVVSEGEKSRNLLEEKNRFEQMSKELESLLSEQEADYESLKKRYQTEKASLESELEIAKQSSNEGRVLELEALLKKVQEEYSLQQKFMEEDKKKIDELTTELTILRDTLGNVSGQLEDTVSEFKRLQAIETDVEGLVDKLKDKSDELDRIEQQVRDILRQNGQEGTDNIDENLTLLVSLIDTIKRKREQAIAPTPRYVIFESAPSILELIDSLEGKAINFGPEAVRLEKKLFTYSLQVYEVYEHIRRNIVDTEFIHRLHGRILTKYRKGMVDAPLPENELLPTIIEKGDDNKQLIGKATLIDVFSAIIPTTLTSNVNMAITSGLMRTFNYEDALQLVGDIIPNQGIRGQIVNSLRNIILSMGVEVPNLSQRLYDVYDMYVVQMMLIDEIRSYLLSAKVYTRDFIYGLEVRMVLLDAFIKAYLETKLATDEYRSVFKTKVVEPDRKDKLISYIRVRADNNTIDPRFSLLVNEGTVERSRSKLLLSHQPYIVSSLSVNDSETPYYQNDMYGPFTRIFLPNESNNEISGGIGDLVDSLNNNKDVCTLALGPSGSGKTSTLLYFRGSENMLPAQGIIPLMLNRLDSRFKFARVTAFEFAANYEYKPGDTYWKKYSVFQEPVVFQRSGLEWESEGSVNIESFSYDETRNICELPSPFRSINRKQYKLGDISLGNFVAKLTDIRLNCGTPNNPVSSRTHLFLFIKLMTSPRDDSGPTLTVADLAGREKSFDCESDAILEVFALNKSYPSLNSSVNAPLGTGSESPLLEFTKGEFDTEAVLTRMSKTRFVNNVADPLSNYPLKTLFSTLSLNNFFGFIASGKGYVQEGNDISPLFYNTLSRVAQYMLERGFHEQLISRLEKLESQPLELRKLLEQLDNRELLANILSIVTYFAQRNITVGSNILAGRPQINRLGKTVEVIRTALGLMRVYLNAILLMDYTNSVLKKEPVKVCRYRNIEGEFINRSLDELSNLIVTALSFETEGGPVVHSECLPVTCSFAGLDCLMPKNVPKDFQQSAISQVLSEGTGRKSLNVKNTVFCTFVVINISKNLSEGRTFRPIYDSAENMVSMMVNSFAKIKKDMKFYITDPKVNSSTIFSGIQDNYDLFLTAYNNEVKLQENFKRRLEYRGVDPTKMLSEMIRSSLYRGSKDNWDAMRRVSENILKLISNKDLLKIGMQKIMELDPVFRKMEELLKFINIKNQDTSVGVLMFADEIAKRGLQPLTCSVGPNDQSVILPSTVGWINVQLSI